jgi:hypothetical protein
MKTKVSIPKSIPVFHFISQQWLVFVHKGNLKIQQLVIITQFSVWQLHGAEAEEVWRLNYNDTCVNTGNSASDIQILMLPLDS